MSAVKWRQFAGEANLVGGALVLPLWHQLSRAREARFGTGASVEAEQHPLPDHMRNRWRTASRDHRS